MKIFKSPKGALEPITVDIAMAMRLIEISDFMSPTYILYASTVSRCSTWWYFFDGQSAGGVCNCGIVWYIVLSGFLLTLQEQQLNSLTLWKKRLALTNEDRRQLLSGGWLTASHISAAHHLLKDAFPKQNRLCDTCYLADKFMWS